MIGAEGYDKIHSEGLLHRFVIVHIFDQNGRLFVQKRSTKKVHGGLYAESLCAHVRKGEDYLQAARRRMHEELSISSNIMLEEVAKIHVYTEEEHWKNNAYVKIFECKILEQPIINSSEIQEGFFTNIEDVVEQFRKSPESFVPGFKQTFREFLSRRHSKLLERLDPQ